MFAEIGRFLATPFGGYIVSFVAVVTTGTLTVKAKRIAFHRDVHPSITDWNIGTGLAVAYFVLIFAQVVTIGDAASGSEVTGLLSLILGLAVVLYLLLRLVSAWGWKRSDHSQPNWFGLSVPGLAAAITLSAAILVWMDVIR